MKKVQKLIALVFIALFSIPALAQKVNPKEETWLWEVSGNGLEKPSYLFGTLHILCPNDFAIAENIKNKLEISAQLVLEVADAENPANFGIILQSMALKGKKLKELYTPEEYAELAAFFADSLKGDIEMFQNFTPMFCMVGLLPSIMGCTETKSYETELTAIARKQGKEVKEVETLQQQLSIFDTIPYHIQAAELLRMVREWTKEKATFKTLVAIYKNNQYSMSQAFLHASMGNMVEYKDLLLDNRNKEWIAKIKTLAAQSPTFFAFGAGHLGGENGLIALLTKEGFTLKPLKN